MSFSDLAWAELEELNEPWGDNYEQWTEDITPDNTTDPSVPFLAAILSDDNSTRITDSDWDVWTYCSLLNEYLEEGDLGNANLNKIFMENGPQLLLQCISYTNVTRSIKAGLKSRMPELTDSFELLNVTGDDGAIAMSKTTATYLAKVMNNDCASIRCGRAKGEFQEKAGEEDMSKFCELENLFVNGTKGTEDMMAFEPALRCRQNLCDRAKNLLKADPDIGGAGVFISYLIQIFLCISIGLYVVFKLTKGIFEKQNLKFRPKHQHLQRSPSVVAHPAFERVLYLFTRVQAWFVVSLIISGAIRTFDSSTSDVDEYLLLTIALNGIALLSFTLLTVHELLRKRSPTTLALSATAFIAAAIFYVIFVKERDNSLASLVNTVWYCSAEELGTTSDWVTTLAFLRKVNKIPAGAFYFVLIFCTLVEFSVIIFQCVPSLEDAWRRQNRYIRGAVYTFVAVMYLGIFVLMFFMLASYFKITDFTEWGFGQLMACLFWAPIVYDYMSERWLDPAESPLQSQFIEKTVYLEPLKGEAYDQDHDTTRERPQQP